VALEIGGEAKDEVGDVIVGQRIIIGGGYGAPSYG
jgi:hypothetical protein